MEKEMVLINLVVLLCIVGILGCIIALIINDKQMKNLFNREKNKSYEDKVWSWLIEDASKFD